MEILRLVKGNQIPKKQKGQLIESGKSFYVRYYVTNEDGNRVQKAEKLADRSDLYRSKADVKPLMDSVMARVNGALEVHGSGQQTLSEDIAKCYLPWIRENKAASTAHSYERIWERSWQKFVGKIALTDLTTADVTKVLTHHAKNGLAVRSCGTFYRSILGSFTT